MFIVVFVVVIGLFLSFSVSVRVCSTLFCTYLSFIVFLFDFHVLKSCASLSSILLHFMVQLRYNSLIKLDLDLF